MTNGLTDANVFGLHDPWKWSQWSYDAFRYWEPLT